MPLRRGFLTRNMTLLPIQKAQIKDTNTNDRKAEINSYSTIVDSAVTTATFRIKFTADKVCQMYYKFETEAGFTKIPFSSVPKDHTWVGAKTGIFLQR